MSEPVRIKLYGLFSVTRRGYVSQLVLGAFLLLALLLIRSYLPPVPELAAGETPWRARAMLWLLVHLHWVVLGFAILFGVEAFFVLRRFAREERRRQAQEKAGEPGPPNEAPGEPGS